LIQVDSGNPSIEMYPIS